MNGTRRIVVVTAALLLVGSTLGGFDLLCEVCPATNRLASTVSAVAHRARGSMRAACETTSASEGPSILAESLRAMVVTFAGRGQMAGTPRR